MMSSSNLPLYLWIYWQQSPDRKAVSELSFVPRFFRIFFFNKGKEGLLYWFRKWLPPHCYPTTKKIAKSRPSSARFEIPTLFYLRTIWNFGIGLSANYHHFRSHAFNMQSIVFRYSGITQLRLICPLYLYTNHWYVFDFLFFYLY